MFNKRIINEVPFHNAHAILQECLDGALIGTDGTYGRFDANGEYIF